MSEMKIEPSALLAWTDRQISDLSDKWPIWNEDIVFGKDLESKNMLTAIRALVVNQSRAATLVRVGERVLAILAKLSTDEEREAVSAYMEFDAALHDYNALP